MNSRILAALAVAASSFVVTACGQSSSPAVGSNVQPTPVTQPPIHQAAGSVQVPATVPTPAPAVAAPVAAPSPVLTAAAPVAAPAQMQALAAPLAKLDKLVIQGLASQVPAAWTPAHPSSTMRVAQFALPPASGSDVGEVAAYFFPTGQGGGHEANIERWTSQFASADGKPVAPKISTGKSGDTEVTLVELQGTYARGVGMGPTGDAKPDQTLLTAMVETSIGRITLQMYGPSKTVSAQRDNFLKLAKGFRPA